MSELFIDIVICIYKINTYDTTNKVLLTSAFVKLLYEKFD